MNKCHIVYVNKKGEFYCPYCGEIMDNDEAKIVFIDMFGDGADLAFSTMSKYKDYINARLNE